MVVVVMAICDGDSDGMVMMMMMVVVMMAIAMVMAMVMVMVMVMMMMMMIMVLVVIVMAIATVMVVMVMVMVMVMMMMMVMVLQVFFSISGTAGDSLRYHENKNFSTNFQDNNQQEPTSCPQHFLGAWWHDGCNPLQSNLNGGYFKKNSVLWLSLKGYRNSLKSTSMKIRSVTGERMHCSRVEK